MQFSIRNLLGLATLAAIICLPIATAQGPILRDGVAFYGPIILCSILAWHLILRRNTTSLIRSFLIGGIAGLIGTLVWPAGLLAWIVMFGNPEQIPALQAMLLACILVSLALGGAITTALKVGFPSKDDKPYFETQSSTVTRNDK